MSDLGQIPADLANLPTSTQALVVALAQAEVARRTTRDRSERSLALLGMAMSFAIVTALIVVGTVLTLKDHDTVGGVIFGTTILAFAGAFAYGQVAKSKQ